MVMITYLTFIFLVQTCSFTELPIDNGSSSQLAEQIPLNMLAGLKDLSTKH